MPDHEVEFAKFVVPRKRRRCREMLASVRHRVKFLGTLHHFADFDPRASSEIPRGSQFAAHIERALRERGAPDTCYVISADSDLDGQEMSLSDALNRIVGSSNGTVVSCVPGRLAYFEGEHPCDRLILDRCPSRR
jgi:hypothetical protein